MPGIIDAIWVDYLCPSDEFSRLVKPAQLLLFAEFTDFLVN